MYIVHVQYMVYTCTLYMYLDSDTVLHLSFDGVDVFCCLDHDMESTPEAGVGVVLCVEVLQHLLCRRSDHYSQHPLAQ